MKRVHHIWGCFILFIPLLYLTACVDSDEGEPTGFLTVEITDAPLDRASAVVLQLASIEIKPAFDDEVILFEYEAPGMGFELDKYTRGITLTLIPSLALTPGEYEHLRLNFNAEPSLSDDSFIVINDATHPIALVDNPETKLTVSEIDGAAGFTIAHNQKTRIVIDFDLRKSLSSPAVGSEDYMLDPVLRAATAEGSSVVQGLIDNEILADTKCELSNDLISGRVIFLFSGVNAFPEDDDALNTALRRNEYASSSRIAETTDGSSTLYVYNISFLPPGNYSMVVACENPEDTGDSNNRDFRELTRGSVTLTAGVTTRVDF